MDDTTIQRDFISFILQPYLHKNIISIINNYSHPLYYYTLVCYDGKYSFDKCQGMYISEMFQASSIGDVIKYILYSYKGNKELFVSFWLELASLKNNFIKELSHKEKQDFDKTNYNFFCNKPKKKNQILLLAQELYGKNPRLFLKDMYDMHEIKKKDDDLEFCLLNCFSLIKYTDLFRCIGKTLPFSEYKCINIYTNQKIIFNLTKT